MNKMEFTPLIIMGATRSGTNALRDSLTSLDDFETWPCDEINGIWKYLSLSKGFDNLLESDLSQSKIKYIRSKFIKQFNESGQPKFIVEKTCANTMRPRFVNGVLPEAKYIYIIRDGSEVAKSAKRRWQGDFEYNLAVYWFKKIKYIPARDLSSYLYSGLSNRLAQKILRRSELKSWGPSHPTLERFKDKCSLEDLVALQWSLCVISSWYHFRNMGPDKCVFVTYHELLDDPSKFLWRLEKMVDSKLTAQSDVEKFSSGLLFSERQVEPYVANDPVIRKYFNLATKIYKKIANNDFKKR